MRTKSTSRAYRMWILTLAVLLAVAGAEGESGPHHGGPPDGGPPDGGPPDGGPPNRGPPNGGPPDGGPPDGGPPDGGPPDGGPPNGGPPGHDGHDSHGGGHGDGGGDGPAGGPPSGPGGMMPHGGEDDAHGPPPKCTSQQTQHALEASTAYVSCSGLNYADFMALVHADVALLEEAATCFAETVEGMEDEEPNEEGEIVIEVDNVFAECIEKVEAADDTKASEATAEFLDNMLGSESKVCSCLPAYVEMMPFCDMWARYRQFGQSLVGLCESVDTASLLPVQSVSDVEPQGEREEAEEKDRSGEIEVMKEQPFGPCPPGQEAHPRDPTQCQPSTTTEESFQTSGSAPPGRGEGSVFGTGLSILVVIAVGGAVGVGGVWAWSKFQGGMRQPGVRYMATPGDNDIGTELGPFGREYA